MTIQIKRAEREKKRQELETEFSAVFQEVEKKKKALERLELSLADMEATRWLSLSPPPPFFCDFVTQYT